MNPAANLRVTGCNATNFMASFVCGCAAAPNICGRWKFVWKICAVYIIDKRVQLSDNSFANIRSLFKRGWWDAVFVPGGY